MNVYTEYLHIKLESCGDCSAFDPALETCAGQRWVGLEVFINDRDDGLMCTNILLERQKQEWVAIHQKNL